MRETMKRKKDARVYFIGAGPGDPELLTVKGRRIISNADVIIYAGSLIHPRIVSLKKKGAASYDSASMNLREMLSIMVREAGRGRTIARIHSGDPALYGAIREQMIRLERKKIPYEVVPGVSSVFAAAAALKRERYPHPGERADQGAGPGVVDQACPLAVHHGHFSERRSD
jgi:precorrin-4/cobalt-precorrin-4 C11-methyltransferase